MQMKYILLFFALFLTLAASPAVYSQLEYSNWYFGKQAGITFKTQTGDPMEFPGNTIQQYEGCASLSDFAGNMILYTNGVIVVNGQNQVLNQSGIYMKGHQSSTQSAIIIKKPGAHDIYYIFTADAAEYLDPPNEGINYTIVDMGLNGGKGAITDLNIPLLGKASEKLTATPHANGKDIWIVARGFQNNNFYAWLLSDTGIIDTVITPIGYTVSSNIESIGYLRFSPKGNKAAIVYQDRDFFELYRFDNISGTFSDLLQIPVKNYYNLYGVEFSPNGNYLYISNSRTFQDYYTVFQFDVSSHDPSTISNSKYVVANDNGNVGALQRAPDNKIYMAVLNESYLIGISNPNIKCPSCGFGQSSVTLGDSLSYMGLPQSFPKFDYMKTIYACEFQPVTLDPEDFLFDTSKYINSYEWKGPNAWSSGTPRPTLPMVIRSDSGNYTLTINYTINGEVITVTFTNKLVVIPKNEFNIVGPAILCEGDEVSIVPDTANPLFRYRWSTGSTSRRLSVNKPGTYKLYITSINGCLDSAEITIAGVPKPNAQIEGSRLICNNQPVTLESVEQSDTLIYLWSTGSTNKSITVVDTGTYWLTISNSYGCRDSASIKIVRIDSLKVKIGGDSVICAPNAALIYSIITPYDSTLNYEYLWSSGQTDSLILINKPGKIKLTVTIEGNCVYTDEITLKKIDAPIVGLNYKDTVNLCIGDKVILEAINPDSNLLYIWNDSTQATYLEVTYGGLYTLKAFNAAGCYGIAKVYVKILSVPNAKIVERLFSKDCLTDSIALSAYPKGNNYKYQWSNGELTDSIIVKKSGYYSVMIFDENNCSKSIGINVELGSGLKVAISGNKLICEGDSLVLTANPNMIEDVSNFKFQWSTGDTTKSIIVRKTDRYWVFVRHTGGCTDSDSVDVNVLEYPISKLNLSGEFNFCRDTIITLQALEINPNFNYFWADGFNKPIREISKSGTYKIYVSNKNLCFDSSEVTFNFLNFPQLNIISDKEPTLCTGDEIVLSVSGGENLKFQWSNGGVDSLITVYQPGYYYLLYSNDYGCKDSIGFTVNGGTVKGFEILTDKSELCNGEIATLSTSEDFVAYLWSNGETTKSISVNDSGDYYVQVWDENGCTSSAGIKIIKLNSEISFEIISDTNFADCQPNYSNSIIIRNTSGFEYFISDVLISGNYELINKQDLIGTFGVDEEKILLFRIINQKIGLENYKATLIIEKPCPNQFEFSFNYTFHAQTSLKIDTNTFEAGSEACISIYYFLDCPVDYLLNSGFTLTIDIPADYFYPENINIGSIINKEFINNYWRLTIEVVDFSSQELDSLLLRICGKVLIGSNTKEQIKIVDMKWTNSNINVKSENGIIATAACAIGIRAIKYFKPTSLNISPNPVKDGFEILIETASVGDHKLNIYTSSGELVKEINLNHLEKSTYIHKILLNSQDFNQGFYFAMLESPWGIINSMSFIIVK